jgi:signal transduction histidine kinase
LRRYGFAVGAVACALALTPLLRPLLEPMPVALFVAAVLASAWYGGAGPGLVALLLWLLTQPIVVPPEPEPNVAKVLAWLSFLVAMTTLIGWQSSANRRARAALRLLADVGQSLAASLDPDATLTTTACLAVPHLADGCVVDLLADDGCLRCAAAAHPDAVLENKLRLAAQSEDTSLQAEPGVAEVARTGRLLVCARLSTARLQELVPRAARRQALVALGVRSLLIVPLVARGRTLGTLTLLSSHWLRRFGRADLALAVELAQRAALALDNARLYREARDMEEALRRRADQLTAADRNKDAFLAAVAHELRGPLGALRNALEVVRRQGSGAPAADAPLGIMARQVDALARLVEDLLDVAGIAQGKVMLRRQPLDLADVVRAAAATARPLLDARRHTLTVTLPREGLRLDGDALRLEQVFVNLLTNAAKYTEPGGHVWLSAAAEAAQAVVSVRDSGIGMAPEFLARAFDLFAQGPEALERSQGGLGIGLTLVRRLVQLHSGTVEAHSDGPGRGSEFVVRLPLQRVDSGQWTVDSGSAPLSTVHCPLSTTASPSTKRVLVVDDNPDIAAALAMLLSRRGHEVRVAADGPSALAVVQDFLPDVVFLDLGLPGMDGHEVGRRLRGLSGLERALIVALTGSSAEDDRQRSHEAGFDHHLVKPVDPEDIDRLLSA